MMRGIKKFVPLSVKHRLAYLRHSALSRVPSTPEVRLRVEQVGDFWSITDLSAGASILVPSFERWHRYRLGISAQLDAVARQYRIGNECQLTAGDRVIDIGANVGEFTLYSEEKGASVLAIEADRGVGSLLLKNIETCSGVEVELVPVWNRNEAVVFYSSPESADSSVIRPDQPIRSTVKRQAFALDTIASRWFPKGTIHLIKCDAEGAEPEVLSGASATLARTRWVAIDCGPERHGESTIEECSKLLTDAEFELIEAPSDRRQVLLARNSGNIRP